MRGPSLDAIRKFKEQQEIRKREEEERKIQEKLVTLEHRASQGDRKARQNLKRIEKVKSESNKTPAVSKSSVNERTFDVPKSQKHAAPKPNKVVTDFEEVMRLARSNNNEIRKESPVAPKQPPLTQRPSTSAKKPIKNSNLEAGRHLRVNNIKLPAKPPQVVPARKSDMNKAAIKADLVRNPRKLPNHTNYRPQYNDNPRFSRFHEPRANHHDDYEDEYEQDDFVVDDDGEDAQVELRKTLQSVFRYDKTRCDLREQELDRQYREIGRVSTFEDLEREERRATRIARDEDNRALREEEERKRLKKLRLKKG